MGSQGIHMFKQNHIKIIKKTPFGSLVIIWAINNQEPLIKNILLSKVDASAIERASILYGDAVESSCAKIEDVAKNIESFLNGEDVEFSLDLLAWEMCTPFQKLVLKAEYSVPRGFVTTYKSLARYLSNEKGSRAVGNALANNPFPIIIPCHRSIRSDMTLGGYQGGLNMKKALLEFEGIVFDDKGKVTSPLFDLY